MVNKIGSAAAAAAAQPSVKTDFAAALKKRPVHQSGATGAGKGTANPASNPNATNPKPRAEGIDSANGPSGTKIIGQVQLAQSRLDHLLKLAETGRSFTPAELLAFQAHAYRASQELDLAGKVVEKGTAAVKQTLQTQI